MPNPRPKPLAARRLFALTALLTSAGLLSTGCSDAADSGADGTQTKIYTTRGQVVELPAADNPAASLRIQHEAISDFLHKDGQTRGMDAMTMGFPVGDGVDLAGLSVGDKVAVTFEVTWGEKRSGWETTALEKLPADTDLALSDSHADHATHTDHGGHAGHTQDEHAGHGH